MGGDLSYLRLQGVKDGVDCTDEVQMDDCPPCTALSFPDLRCMNPLYVCE